MGLWEFVEHNQFFTLLIIIIMIFPTLAVIFTISAVSAPESIQIINKCANICYVDSVFGLEGERQKADCTQNCINSFVIKEDKQQIKYANSKWSDENWTIIRYPPAESNNCYKAADGCNTVCCDDKNRSCTTTLMYCGE